MRAFNTICKYSLSLISNQKSTIDDYQITGFLGQGSTSRVFQGYHILSQQQVIIKLFKNIPQQKIHRQIRSNQIIIGCDNVIPLIDTIQDPVTRYYCMIFQNFKGITLNHLIGKFGFKQAIKYAIDLLKSLDCIHSKGLIHRDLKASNILVTKTGAKLFDFGLSRIEGVDSLKTKRFGTKCYYTPEVMFRVPQFSKKIDIWVLGVIIAQMVCKRKPLMPYESDQKTLRQIVYFSGYDERIVDNPNFKSIKKINWFEMFDRCDASSEQITQIIQALKKMLKIVPQQRPSASEILKQKIFQKYMDN